MDAHNCVFPQTPGLEMAVSSAVELRWTRQNGFSMADGGGGRWPFEGNCLAFVEARAESVAVHPVERSSGPVQHVDKGVRLQTSRLGDSCWNSLRVHDLRHTVASHAVMSGENLPLVGQLLGHRRHRWTAGYAHVADRHLVDAAEKIGGIMARAMTGKA